MDDALPIDIKGDLNSRLPFKDKQFKKVTMFHVLEHLNNPVKTLNELVRIADLVEVRLPHKYSISAMSDRTHKHTFDCSWFHTYAKKHKLRCYTATRLDTERFHPLRPLMFEIIVWLW